MDYDEIFSPIVRHTLLQLVAQLEQLDVKTTFLHGELDKEIYMTQLDGSQVPGKEDLVCKLRSLYGQSPRQWYKRFDGYMMHLGYNRSPYDCCVYHNMLTKDTLIYVDMLIASKNKSDIQKLKGFLSAEFEMKNLGAAKKIRMEIYNDRSQKKFLSKKDYIEKILSRFGMSNSKSLDTPATANIHLSTMFAPKFAAEEKYMSQVPYSSAVGSLMYIMVCTRPDLANVVSVVKFMGKPGKEHSFIEVIRAIQLKDFVILTMLKMWTIGGP